MGIALFIAIFALTYILLSRKKPLTRSTRPGSLPSVEDTGVWNVDSPGAAALVETAQNLNFGTTNDADADKSAQVVYRELAAITEEQVIVNGLTAADLQNLHALVPTPEQQAAGAVPLASLPQSFTILRSGVSDEEVIAWLTQRGHQAGLARPIIPTPTSLPLRDAYGDIYGLFWPARGWQLRDGVNRPISTLDSRDYNFPANVSEQAQSESEQAMSNF